MRKFIKKYSCELYFTTLFIGLIMMIVGSWFNIEIMSYIGGVVIFIDILILAFM